MAAQGPMCAMEESVQASALDALKAVELMGETDDYMHTARRMPRKRTVTILDWDDTLLASTHLFAEEKRAMAKGERHASETFTEQMRILEDHVISLLAEAQKFGDVIIITNAEAGWVEMSGQQFMPNVISHLQRHNIRVVSARSSCESVFPMEPIMWKTTSFWNELVSMYTVPSDLNVLVIGDGVGERVAAQLLQLNLANSVVKTLMLLPAPTAVQLTEELSIATSYLEDFAELNRPLEFCLYQQPPNN
eukprot:Plantae.Rhodophyta-Purpureofilum_apyrenoidigerum.ctg2964.p1 GENE.Plantae.Rhodophyta-Purpureofilum_apyrenoidigerum.ctg2964~~Plantae.Rhodophyta-Purpureofilum_apyrenoidigerum.ctg2964.p1  ORF type:complete len:291 (-),score=36.01 Plantae.Rhodophyta-Purpureofilum_apyrenoidigerum.ctg2964:54-800(-)